MKTLIALIAALILVNASADEKSQQLDRKVVALLLEQSDLVVLCSKDAGGNVGMDARLKTRYGLVGTESGFGLPVKETMVGTPVQEKVLGFWFSRKPENEPFFLPKGDYVLFLRRGPQNRWVLVGDFIGMQLATPGFAELIKEVHAAKGK